MKIKKIKNKDEYYKDIIKDQQLKVYKYYKYYELNQKELKRLDELAKKISKIGIKLSEAIKAITLFYKAYPKLFDTIYMKK